MNEPYADKWQQYFAPQVAARNRWATHQVRDREGGRRSLPRRIAPVVALATGLGFGVFALTPAAHASTDVASVTFWPTGGASRVYDDRFDGGAGAPVSAQGTAYGADRTFRTR